MKYILIAIYIFLANHSFAKTMAPREIREMQRITSDKNLSVAEQKKLLLPYLDNKAYYINCLYFLSSVDRPFALSTALKLFRDKTISTKDKITIGRMIYGFRKFRKKFLPEYTEFLIKEGIKNGKQEFIKKNASGHPTIIREIAFMASGFSIYSGQDYAHFFDNEKLKKVLTACLHAPDTVYSKRQGCVIRGTPGESTGRNTGRQQIPTALSRLNVIEATDQLEIIAKTHHDEYLRRNAAKAVESLTDGRIIINPEKSPITRLLLLLPVALLMIILVIKGRKPPACKEIT